MTKKEAAKIIAILTGYYPDSFKNLSDDQTKSFIEVWTRSFEEESFLAVETAVMDFIQNSMDSFMPTVGKIKAILNEYRFAEAPNEMEAFEMLLSARRQYSPYSENDADPFPSLPTSIQRAIGSKENFVRIGQLNRDSETFSIEKNNFMRAYRGEVEREKRNINRPRWLAAAIEAVSSEETSRTARKLESRGKRVSIPEQTQKTIGEEK